MASGLLAASLLVTLAWGAPRRDNAAETSPTSTPYSLAGLSSVVSLDAPDTKGGTHPAAPSKAFKGKLPVTQLNEEETIQHALNRLGYGPRPGDIEHIRKMGLERWINQQLHPDSIDDSALRARLGRYPTLTLSTAVLINEYPRPEVAAKRMRITVDEYRKRMTGMAKERAMGGMGSAMRPPDTEPQRIVDELQMAKLARAIYSERQFEEQLTDFWFNHFNVFIYKDQIRYLVPAYERDVIRPHVLGKFKDLLYATATSPAMLYYLDNWISADPNSFERLRHLPADKRKAPKGVPGLGPKRGLNENYGRELLELHTVGVDGGYSQKDVIAVARCFTGWTVQGAPDDPQFYFDNRVHDLDEKIVMGKKIRAGGMKDGMKVLEMLSRHPSTAKFISTKLARHFVSDNPPPELVARMAKTFKKTDGDIRAVLETMIYSAEFWSRQTYRAKVKTPFELVTSTARALQADVDLPQQLVQWVARIGEPLYQCLPPTGYSDRAEAWVNTGALLNRLNFAMAAASNRIRGARVDLTSLVGDDVATDPKRALDRAVDEFLAGQAAPETRATLEQKSSDPQVLRAKLDDPVQHVDLGIITGLVLGSPEFQRR